MSASEGNAPEALSDHEEDPVLDTADGDEDVGDDLFGDEEEEAPPALEEDDEPAQERHLDDEELDSGDDLGRNDRTHDAPDAAADEEELEQNVVQVSIPRHAIPEPSDNELYLLKVPRFLNLEPSAYSHTTFTPPVTDHHSKEAPSATFSAYNTALTTLRWRHSPTSPHSLQSNARILRYSDGTLTLQFASDPTTQYTISSNMLAPAQHNPIKPTPNSTFSKKPAPQYNPNEDSWTYLASAYSGAGFVKVAGKLTCGLNVQQSNRTEDDAAMELERKLKSARRTSLTTDATESTIDFRVDPEHAQRAALAAEKEKQRAQRRLQLAAEKELNRTSRALGRSSGYPRSGGGGGLTLEGLEGDGGTGSKRRGGVKQARRQARREVYSDEEEEWGRGRRGKEDEYDEEDDFIAASDEDEEGVGDDDDEEDELDEQLEREERAERQAKKDKKRKSPKNEKKRRSPVVEDEDAPGEEVDDDDEIVAPRGKRRRVVDSDEE